MEVTMTKHIYERHEDCTKEHCPICEGGLAFCTVCRKGGGDLADECPGPSIPEWMQRVIDERKELRDRYDRLRAFMGGHIYSALPWYDRRLMRRQADVMASLDGILGERIARFRKDGSTGPA